jgi:hypothetical protein
MTKNFRAKRHKSRCKNINFHRPKSWQRFINSSITLLLGAYAQVCVCGQVPVSVIPFLGCAKSLCASKINIVKSRDPPEYKQDREKKEKKKGMRAKRNAQARYKQKKINFVTRRASAHDKCAYEYIISVKNVVSKCGGKE